MNKYVIMMDVSGDVTQETVDTYDLKFVPMQYSLGEEMRTSYGREPEEIMKKFYEGQKNGDLTRTSQITPYMYEEYFSPYLKDGYSVLYLCLSSGLSSTFSAALLAKESLKEKFPDVDVFPIDSLSATGGMGLLIERALVNRKNGMSIEENYEDILNVIPKVRCWFMVQDLQYLKRGGRISSTTAFVGGLLNIKPILRITPDGKLLNIGKKRGNKATVNALFEYFKENYNPDLGNTIYICDTLAKDLSEDLKNKVLEIYPNMIVKQETLCPIIGAHTGPGMLVISHFAK
ncbi:MAG: DegV family protein [Anaeroplasmataceae bacterium]|nr:DegV family protein [Anaeroplasmataceae bacterium]